MSLQRPLTWLPAEERKSEYKYDKLLNDDSTRLLTLSPSTDDSKGICYELESVQIAEVVDTYDALSYVWGSPERSVDATCNGLNAFLTVNLAEALRAIRDPKKPKRLWADAICINQKNHEEKGQQVKRMGNVYQNATRVLVWLGHDSEGIANDCFNLIRETNIYMDLELEKHGNDYRNIPTIIEGYPLCNDKTRWAKVKQLISLPWFKRVWVVQEAGLAKECILLWGQYRIAFAHVVEFILWRSLREDLSELTGITGVGFLNDVFWYIQYTYDNVKTWRTSLPLISDANENNWRSISRNNVFLDTLVAGTGLLAFDDRDHVYALLGSPLARFPEGGLIVEPEYNKPLHDVFFDTACALLQHPREAPYVLTRVKHRSSSDLSDPLFPSWVPRWDTGLIPYLIARPKFWFRAGGTSAFKFDIRPDKCLAFRGYVFDRIVWVSKVIHEHNFRVNPDNWDNEFRAAQKPFIDALMEDALSASKFALHTSQNPHQERLELENRFSYTLVRGYPADIEHKISLAQHQAEFEAYRVLVRSAAQTKPDTNSKPGLLSSSTKVSPLNSKENDVAGEHTTIFPRNFLHRIYYSTGLRLALTESKRFGLVPAIAQLGDECFVLPGVSVPMILRSRSESPGNPLGDARSKVKELGKEKLIYSLIGEAYIDGVMAGEVMKEPKEVKCLELNGLIS